jgi:hypothetical protein
MEHSIETQDLGWSLIQANGGNVLKALRATGEDIERLGDVLQFLQDLYEQQLQAGDILFALKEAKKGKR